MREITISAGHCQPGEQDADRWQRFNEQCGGDEPIRNAIGYLSLWNWSSFPHVDIVLMGSGSDMELLASYRKEKGGPTAYVLGAVWHGDHFGFHS